MIEIDLELYKIFYTVATLKSITKAANSLYISQPAVTMSIKKLEEQLGVTLFVRTKRGVILTNEGSVLYEYVERAMENIKIGENRLDSLKKLDTGNIRIGVSTTLTNYFLMDYLKKFHEKFPKVSISIRTGQTFQRLKDLEYGNIDIAIVTSDILDYSGLKVEYSEDIQDIFVANESYKELTKKEIPLSELNSYPILFQISNSNTRQFLDSFLSENNIKLSSIMELANYSLVIEFAKIGMGIGFIAKNYIKKELENNELYEIKTTPGIPKRKILVLTRKDYLPSFSVSKLIEIIKENK